MFSDIGHIHTVCFTYIGQDIVDKLYTQVSLIYLGTVYENWTQLVYSDLSHVM